MVAELIRGELFLQPRPALPHAQASSVLGMLLGPPFHLGQKGPGGWWIQHEPEIHLDAHILVPDLAAWRREAAPAVDMSAAFATVRPNWVCEILSPRTQRTDRVRKLPIYAEHGVQHAWLVDPLNHTLEVFRLDAGRWSLLGTHADDEVVRAEPFDAVGIALHELWVAEFDAGLDADLDGDRGD